MKQWLPVLYLFFCTAFFISNNANAAPENTATIAAAANLQFALPQIAERFSKDTNIKLKIVYGSSGNFSRQIRQGAPFDLFISADETYVQALHTDGLVKDTGRVYAKGRLALATALAEPTDSSESAPNPIEKLRRQLQAGTIKRFAIANPAHAPYGVRAQQVLEKNGLWEPLRPFLVYGENVAQAAQFALSSNAQGGIIANSLASAPTLADKGNFYRIPAEFHEPLFQRMVMLKHNNDSAREFFQYMQSETATQILESYGFDQPGATE